MDLVMRRKDGQEALYDGRGLKFLTVVDEYSRECLAIMTKRRLKSFDVLNALADLFLEKGLPRYIRSDNGPGSIMTALAGLGSALTIEKTSQAAESLIQDFMDNGNYQFADFLKRWQTDVSAAV